MENPLVGKKLKVLTSKQNTPKNTCCAFLALGSPTARPTPWPTQQKRLERLEVSVLVEHVGRPGLHLRLQDSEPCNPWPTGRRRQGVPNATSFAFESGDDPKKWKGHALIVGGLFKGKPLNRTKTHRRTNWERGEHVCLNQRAILEIWNHWQQMPVFAK